MIELSLQGPSLDLGLIQNPNPLLTRVVFLLTNPHPEASRVTLSHLISTTKTPVTLKIPKVFEALDQKLRTKTRYTVPIIPGAIVQTLCEVLICV